MLVNLPNASLHGKLSSPVLQLRYPDIKHLEKLSLVMLVQFQDTYGRFYVFCYYLRNTTHFNTNKSYYG